MTTKYIDINNLKLLQFDLLQSNSLSHFTTTIHGGVSEGNYTSLNLGFYSGDNPENVYENRLRLANAFNVIPENLIIPYQTHQDKIYIIEQTFLNLSDQDKFNNLNEVDALITNQKNICIGITTADCVPLLIYDPLKKVLAAVHAGWKGTVLYIGAKTVKKMIGHFGCNPSDLLISIGPSISPEYFEVGEEVGEAFTNVGFNLSEISYRNLQTGKLHINLWEANRLPLLEIGVLPRNIEVSQICTFSNPDQFFSARRQTIHSGRMVTGAVIR